MNMELLNLRRGSKQPKLMSECKHSNKQFFKVTHNKGFHKALICLDCGKKMPHGTNHGCWWPHDENDISLPEWDYASFEDKIREAQKKESNARQAAFELEERKKHWEYEKYLNSLEWQTKRYKVLKRANFRCESCMDAEAKQVHHCNYKSIFNECLFDLRAVCKQCHQKIHNCYFPNSNNMEVK